MGSAHLTGIGESDCYNSLPFKACLDKSCTTENSAPEFNSRAEREERLGRCYSADDAEQVAFRRPAPDPLAIGTGKAGADAGVALPGLKETCGQGADCATGAGGPKCLFGRSAAVNTRMSSRGAGNE